MLTREHWFVSGSVQHVGFRRRTERFANELGLTGFVRNRWDGRVELEVQGDSEVIAQLLPKIEQSRHIEVETRERETIPVVTGEETFTIKKTC